jgi:hypothetical protein
VHLGERQIVGQPPGGVHLAGAVEEAVAAAHVV